MTSAPDATDARAFYALVDGRRGHFGLESGHHGGLWLDLDALFTEPRRVQPFVDALARAVAPHAPEVICGPLLGGAFLAQLVARTLDVDFAFTERAAATARGTLYGVRYRLPRAVAARVRGRSVALVDDVMSAGSALRGTDAALREAGAVPVVAGALLVLGEAGARWFDDRGVAVVAAARDAYSLWTSDDCPLCAAGAPLEEIAAP